MHTSNPRRPVPAPTANALPDLWDRLCRIPRLAGACAVPALLAATACAPSTSLPTYQPDPTGSATSTSGPRPVTVCGTAHHYPIRVGDDVCVTAGAQMDGPPVGSPYGPVRWYSATPTGRDADDHIGLGEKLHDGLPGRVRLPADHHGPVLARGQPVNILTGIRAALPDAENRAARFQPVSPLFGK